MLPPGHIAAGYLVAKAFIHFVQPAISQTQMRWLIVAGMFFAFAPDLDMFYGFWKMKAFRHTNDTFNHRTFITHTPLPWLVAGVMVMLIGQTIFWRCFGALIWLGSWSHFLFDSSDTGIRWLYPFSQKFYALKNPGIGEANHTKGFFNHWWYFVHSYRRRDSLTFFTEIILLLIAVLIFLR